METIRIVCYSLCMEDIKVSIATMELKGVTIAEIARVLERSLSTINYHRNTPDYQDIMSELESEIHARSSMTLQQRTELMLNKVVSAMEEEMDNAKTNVQVIGMTERLRDLIQVVGKPQQERELGVVQVSGLLTREAFNKGQGDEDIQAVPKGPLPLKDIDSLAFNGDDHHIPKPQESLHLPVGYETPANECDSETYPQEDIDPELIPSEDEEWDTGPDPLDSLNF